jgi:signal transduction histidine kinase
MAAATPVTPAPAPALVYLVDDDPLVLESLGRVLQLETPHTIRTFLSSDVALAAMEVAPPDLVISDQTMPQMGGIELLRRVRNRFPDAARVILTGYGDKESAIRAINDAGIYHYVEKPWDNAELLVIVGNAVDHVRLTRALAETVAALRTRNTELERTLAELRDAQDRLVAAERLAAVGRLASGIAHEIGNQLSLLGYAELLAERYADDPEAKELTDPLLAARRRLSTMVSSIKDFVRGKGTGGYSKTKQPVAPVIDEALSILRFEPALKLRTVERHPDDREAVAAVNREKLVQVILNLIRNAIQSTREGGKLRLGVERQGAFVLVEVQDDGMGIPPALQEKIWEPFFSTKGDAGTGLGLGICRRIVEEHGGTIDARSEGPELGATFTLRLPAL